MNFDLTDIKEAHLKVKSGADFPVYIKDLKKLGVRTYDTYVRDGHSIFFGDEAYQVESERKYTPLTIARISDKERFKHFLKSHQRGQTDYPVFCQNAANTGVEKWTADISSMTCKYYDKAGDIMLEEQIRTP